VTASCCCGGGAGGADVGAEIVPTGPSLTATIVLSRGRESVPRSLRVSVEAHDAEATPEQEREERRLLGLLAGTVGRLGAGLYDRQTEMSF
jgi:hypothetical protein